MSLFKDFDDMIAEIRKQRDSLISDIEEIRSRYQEKETKIQGSFGGVLLEEKMERLEREKVGEYGRCVLYFQGAIFPLFDQLRRKVDLHIKMSNPSDMDDLTRFNGLILTQTEFDYLAKRYGSQNYWSDQYLLMIARKNHLVASNLVPCVDVLINVIDSLEAEAESFVGFVKDGEEPGALLSDDALQEFIDRFKGK